jgi:hypothetical protein
MSTAPLNANLSRAMASWTAADRERFEERAAIREHMGGQGRAEAEWAAYREVEAGRKGRGGR